MRGITAPMVAEHPAEIADFIHFRHMPVTLRKAIFEGVLRVTDAELFTRTLTEGIGRAKAYGNGLLTLRR